MEILLFGITKDIVGDDTLRVSDQSAIRTVSDLRKWLFAQYPAMGELRSLAIAVDNHFADDSETILSSAELALIPPVSGG
ncbi:MAG TPA: MoaD/ThiS family protein [Balneolales bacterium]|nr:MoaD/ThiS family protein [Balneolales bacterium]